MAQESLDRLRSEATGLGKALAERGLSQARERATGLAENLTGPGSPVMPKVAKEMATGSSPLKAVTKATASTAKDKVMDKLGGGKSRGKGKVKVTNIVESIDVPVDRSTAYQQWTQFEDFPSFTKKVENVSQDDDATVTWDAKVFWSKRRWKSTITDQVPDEHIVWASEGQKGHVDGAVTFHELTPDLTRILLTLEYHPKGFMEKTGNIWRAQGRRARLELKHFRRHVAMHTLLHQDEIEGWEGEIHDGEVQQGKQGSDGKKSSAKKSSAKKSSTRKSDGERSEGRPAKKGSGNGSRSADDKSMPRQREDAARSGGSSNGSRSRRPAKKSARSGS